MFSKMHQFVLYVERRSSYSRLVTEILLSISHTQNWMDPKHQWYLVSPFIVI